MWKYVVKQLRKMKHGSGRGIDYNRLNGSFQVEYPCGLISQKFCWDVAKAYRNIFGGKILYNP